MFRRVWFIVSCFAVVPFTSLGALQTESSGALVVRHDVQYILDSIVRTDTSIPGVSIHIEAPRLGLSWTGVAGVANRNTGEALTTRHAFRIASNTKTYVAAAILRLWETGRLELDAPIARYLPSDMVASLRGGQYDPDAITVRHLLTHTSGLYDHAFDPSYFDRVLADPAHRWTRLEQLQLGMDRGEPHGAPGRIHSYSDTGYILLGEIIERLTGQGMGPALRELLSFADIGNSATWHESFEPVPPSVRRAHQYFGGRDTYDWDPSIDLYGGGGLVATMRDMAMFMRALFTNRVYDRSVTADTMLTTLPAAAGPMVIRPLGSYRMGIYLAERNGVTAYRHTGFWGTSADYVPKWDVGFAATVTQQQSARTLFALVARVRDILASHLEG